MFNVPYWPEIYYESGYTDVIATFRNHSIPFADDPVSGLDWQLAPRAKIFRRDHGTVKDINSFVDILRYNAYKTDPYAQGSPWNAICSRGDLASGGGSPDGCYDTKATSATLMAAHKSYMINGPTRGGIDNLPAFTWSQYPTAHHDGLPFVYNFTVSLEQPTWT
jgi:Phospholipase B